jgi:Na+-driven multidrug efflux pump
MMFAPLPGMAIGQGAQPILGYNYGAKRYHHLLKTITIAGISSTVFSILVFLVFYIAPQPFIKIFTNDPEVVASGTHIARLIFLSMPLMGFVHLGTQFFQAIGKAVPALIIAFVRPVVFLIPLVYILSRSWELNGIFLSFPGSDVLTFVLIITLAIPVIRQLKKAAASVKGKNTLKSGQLVESLETGTSR